MREKHPSFHSQLDDFGQPYLAADPLGLKLIKKRQISTKFMKINETTKDICSFLDSKIALTSKQSGIFSTDLTTRDDLIIATFSLVLILAIESILAAILLRSTNGNVSNFGFSIKQFVDLGRNFKFRYLIKGKTPRGQRNAPKNKINYVLLLLATAILLFTFGLETTLLFLSSPHFRDVTNRTATFSFKVSVYPKWEAVRKAAASTIDRPCRDITFVGPGIIMGVTRIVPCVTSSTSDLTSDEFDVTDETLDVTMRSDVHQYGIEHYVSIGGESAKYSARVHTSNIGATTVMKVRAEDRGLQFHFIHRQIIAYLFNMYVQETEDDSMNLARLNAINFNHSLENGPTVFAMRMNEVAARINRETTSMRHTTNFKAKVPKGLAALKFIAIVLRASHGVEVTGPDMFILRPSSGNLASREILQWQEEARSLNWLSLLLMLLASFTLLGILRFVLKSVGVIEILQTVINHMHGEWVGAGEGQQRNEDNLYEDGVYSFSGALSKEDQRNFPFSETDGSIGSSSFVGMGKNSNISRQPSSVSSLAF